MHKTFTINTYIYLFNNNNTVSWKSSTNLLHSYNYPFSESRMSMENTKQAADPSPLTLSVFPPSCMATIRTFRASTFNPNFPELETTSDHYVSPIAHHLVQRKNTSRWKWPSLIKKHQRRPAESEAVAWKPKAMEKELYMTLQDLQLSPLTTLAFCTQAWGAFYILHFKIACLTENCEQNTIYRNFEKRD